MIVFVKILTKWNICLCLCINKSQVNKVSKTFKTVRIIICFIYVSGMQLLLSEQKKNEKENYKIQIVYKIKFVDYVLPS